MNKHEDAPPNPGRGETIVTDPTPPRVGILRCFRCGRTIDCPPAVMLRFTQTGCPRCCDDVMTLFTAADMVRLGRELAGSLETVPR